MRRIIKAIEKKTELWSLAIKIINKKADYNNIDK